VTNGCLLLMVQFDVPSTVQCAVQYSIPYSVCTTVTTCFDQSRSSSGRQSVHPEDKHDWPKHVYTLFWYGELCCVGCWVYFVK